MRNRRYTYLTSITIIAACAVILGFEKASAQTQELTSSRAVEVIVISFEVQKLIKEDILVQYDGDTIYVPLTRVFRLLEIDITPDREKRIFSGQFLSRKNTFKIDMVKMRVQAPNVDYKLTPADYILKEDDLYLRVDLFNRLFALPIVFDFNLLRVFMRLDKELPIYKRLKRQIRHEKLIREKRELGAVSQLPRHWQSFTGGVVDWTISTSPFGGGGQFAQLNLGGVVLGGDIEIRGSGNTRSGIDPRQFTGRWRYFFEDSRFFESAIIGDFFSSGALARSLRGASLTNSPIRRRKY
ncbi:MAG: hypothetical protein IIB00_09805, partial [candidate division Zixibacteria bacterium]|nr:hypothetical protein [candidate division Zixibacteria bacterium]